MKKIFFILLLLTIVFSFEVALSGQVSSDYNWVCETINKIGDMKYGNWEQPLVSKEWRIGISVPHFKSPLWVDNVYGQIIECEKLGLKLVNVSAASGYDDLSTQVSQIEDMVTQEIDALGLGAISYEGNAAIVEWARANGVKAIIGLGQNVKSHGMSGIAGADSYLLGRDMAEWMIQDSGGKANVVVLCGPAGASFSMDHAKGIRDTCANYPDIKIVAERWSDISVPQGQNITEDLISSFPNEIDYIIGTDILGQGAANAVQAAGLQEKIKVLEDWGTRETMSYIRDGRLKALQLPKQVAGGRTAVGMAVMHLEDDFHAPVRVYVMPAMITKDNVNTIDLSPLFAPEGWKVPSKF